MFSSDLEIAHMTMMDMWAQSTTTPAVWDSRYSMETMLKLRPAMEELVFRVSEDGRRSTGFDRMKALGQALISTVTLLLLHRDLPDVPSTVLTTAHQNICSMTALANVATKLGFQRRMLHPASLIVTSTMVGESFATFVGVLWDENQLFPIVETFCEQALRGRFSSVVLAIKDGDAIPGVNLNVRPLMASTTTGESSKASGNIVNAPANSGNGEGPQVKGAMKKASRNQAEKRGPSVDQSKEQNVGNGDKTQNKGGRTSKRSRKKAKLLVHHLTGEEETMADEAAVLTITALDPPIDAPRRSLSCPEAKKSEGAASSERKPANNVVGRPGTQQSAMPQSGVRGTPGTSYQRAQEKLSYERPKDDEQVPTTSSQSARPTVAIQNRGVFEAPTPIHGTMSINTSTRANGQDDRAESSSAPIRASPTQDWRKRKMDDRDTWGLGRQPKRAKANMKGQTDLPEGFKLELENIVKMHSAGVRLEYNLRGLEQSEEGDIEYRTAITIGEPWEVSILGKGETREDSEQDAARQALEALEKLKETIEMETP